MTAGQVFNTVLLVGTSVVFGAAVHGRMWQPAVVTAIAIVLKVVWLR